MPLTRVGHNGSVRHHRLVVAAVLAATLGLGGVVAAGALAGGSAASGRAGAAGATGEWAAAATGAARCDRLAERAAEIPGIRARITERLDAITDRIDAIRSPAMQDRLRDRLQPRIDALLALDDRLAQQVLRVEARCPTAA